MVEITRNDAHPTTQHTHEPALPVSYGKRVRAELREPTAALRREIPAVYDGFSTLYAATYADGALDRKTKELMALAIAVSDQCDGCIAAHAHGAARAGATESEVAETLGVCIQMMGGPGTIYGPRAFAAFREFTHSYLQPSASQEA